MWDYPLLVTGGSPVHGFINPTSGISFDLKKKHVTQDWEGKYSELRNCNHGIHRCVASPSTGVISYFWQKNGLNTGTAL